ncbi:MAG TPA: glycosyltransferase [Candidatus Methylomirabilis sp.]|nr:glycosyltransferase [Candidatus Methylomirabilis sp.]
MTAPGRESRQGETIPLLFLVTSFDRGGAEKVLTRCAAGLPRDKYACQAAALQGRSQAVAHDLRLAEIPVHDLGMACRGDVRILPRLVRLLRRERIRILFTFMFHPNVLGRLVGAACGVPVRISSERVMAWEGRGRRLLNRLTVPLATHVVAVSETVASYASREFRVPPDRLSTIVNGVDLNHFRPSGRDRDGGPVVIGCTARLHPKNDHRTLLQAFARFSVRRPEARLLLVGRGPEEARLRRLADALGISPRAHFLGEQPDVAPWLAQMHLYVQPSVAEGMPNSVLEAMASGLPVVATTVGGTPEVVVDGETGLLVPPRDPAAMAGAIEKISADPVMAEAFGRAGRLRVEMQFGEGVMLERLEALLDRLVAEHLGLAFRPAAGWVRC